MADKRISQLVDRGTVANNDVVPIVVSGATTTNKATISSIQTYMQGNLDLGVTSVGITLGSSGTDVSVSGSPITSSGNITINLPTASATNRGLLSPADWVTFNSKQDAGSFVTLNTAQTITAQKTFTTSGSSDTMIISHGSGSGFALDVLKAGNGEAIRVTKTSGSGNAMTISGGNFEAGTIVKTGGTSSQFLKADGSVDSNTYLTTGTAGSTYVPYSGAAANVDLGVYNITASAIIANGSGSSSGIVHLESNAFHSLVNGYGSIASGTTNQFNLYQTTGAGVFRGAILSLNSITASATRTYTLPDASGTLALSTDLGAYLPLTGGTLSNNLFITGGGLQVSANTSANRQVLEFYTSGSVSRIAASYVGSSSYGDLELLTGGLARLTITAAGVSTFSGALNGTSASFTGDVSILANSAKLIVSESGGAEVRITAGGSSGFIGTYSNHPLAFLTNSTTALTLASTGAATFSSSVTIQSGNSLFVNNASNTRSGFFRTSGEGTELSSFAGAGEPLILIAPDTSASMRFYTGGSTSASERMRITSGGRVGIGQTSPGIALSVAGQSEVWQFGVTSVTGTAGALIGSPSANTLAFGDWSGNERMRITSGGYLKASNTGTYNSGAIHEFYQSVNGAGAAVVTHAGASDPYGLEVNFPSHDPNNATNYMFGAYKTSGGFVWIYRIFSNGTVSARSDARWKKNIETTRNGYIDDLCKLRVVKYNWYNHEDDAPKELGLIAQEVEEIFPNLIQIDPVIAKREVEQEDGTIIEEEFEDGVSRSIKTSVLPFMLLKAMQEQQEQIKELQIQIDSLKNQMQ